MCTPHTYAQHSHALLNYFDEMSMNVPKAPFTLALKPVSNRFTFKPV